jgi:hypothetical protein
VQASAKRLALVVEDPSGHAHVVLDALGRDDPACEVILKHDGLEALDYLLCRGAFAGRDAHIMPCVTLLDLAAPLRMGWGCCEKCALMSRRDSYPWSYSLRQTDIHRLMRFTLQGPIATSP